MAVELKPAITRINPAARLILVKQAVLAVHIAAPMVAAALEPAANPVRRLPRPLMAPLLMNVAAVHYGLVETATNINVTMTLMFTVTMAA